MDADQNDKRRMYNALATVLGAHPEALTPIPTAQDAAEDFGTHLTTLEGLAEAEEQYAPGSETKDALRLALTDAATPVAQSLATWARASGDRQLAEEIGFTRSDFTHGPENDALDRARLVHRIATENAEALPPYGITPAVLTALDGHIRSFDRSLGDPRHAIAERKALNEQIDALFDTIDTLLKERLDPLVEQLRGTSFYTEYRTARRIVDR